MLICLLRLELQHKTLIPASFSSPALFRNTPLDCVLFGLRARSHTHIRHLFLLCLDLGSDRSSSHGVLPGGASSSVHPASPRNIGGCGWHHETSFSSSAKSSRTLSWLLSVARGYLWKLVICCCCVQAGWVGTGVGSGVGGSFHVSSSVSGCVSQRMSVCCGRKPRL